jgi:hypothetical protein
VSQTWGVIATVIKRQEQLNESYFITTDNSQVAMDNKLDTISAITSSDDTALSLLNKAEHDNEYSDTLDTEHDALMILYPKETILTSTSSTLFRSKDHLLFVLEYESS